MIINRHNYEEFFILYMDNELSVEDRRQVEEFVAQYPDLKEELDQLMQFKLAPETISYSGKEELWKGTTLIHSGNQTEWMMLLLDHELSDKETRLVQAYLEEVPAAREEWNKLQELKLAPETIEFTDKSSLYRKEEKRRAIPIFYYRIAAAVILVAIGLGLFSLYNGRDDSSALPDPLANRGNGKASNDSVITEPAPFVDPIALQEVKGTGDAVAKQKGATTAKENKKEGNPVLDKNSIERSPASDKGALAVEKEKERKPSNDLPLPVNNPRIRTEEGGLALNEFRKNNEKDLTIPEVTNPAVAPSDIRTAAYNPDENLEEENGSGKKNRHRGLFRTIARTFEKRTKVDPTEDDKLLVAGFRINLK